MKEDGTIDQNYQFTPLQEKWREIFKKSLWLTTKYLCKFNEESAKAKALKYPMYPYLHGRFLRMVQHNPWQNLAVFMPRGYFKSSMMTVGHKMWRIINNQNIRIMLGNSSENLGKKFLTQMKKIIKSPLFCALFPEIIPQLPPNHPDSDWSKTSFTVNRTDDCTYGESTMMIVTPGTNTEGLHFDDILGNDLVNRTNYKSELKREGIKEFVGNFANLQDSEDTPTEIEGTFWHPDDLYVADILNNPEYTIFYLPLYDSQGNVTFPEKFTPKYIESQRRKLGDKLFTTQMLLNPISEQEAFMSKYPFVRYDEEDGKRITTDGREFDARIIGRMVAMDTAGRGKNLAAISMVDLDNDGNFFVRYVKLRDRWKPSERLAEFKNIDKWFNPIKFGVELESQLMWDSVLPEEFLEGKTNLRLKMAKLTTKGQSKPFRIQNIEPVLAREKIFWHVGIGEKAIKEVQFYPEMMDDAVPDTISYCLSMFPMFHIYPAKQDDTPMAYWEPQHPEIWTFGQQKDEILQKHIEDSKYEEITKDDYRFGKIKPHYFNQEKPDKDDIFLKMAINQGYVPVGCLLGGQVVMGLVNEGKNPCNGCNCDRKKCNGPNKDN